MSRVGLSKDVLWKMNGWYVGKLDNKILFCILKCFITP